MKLNSFPILKAACIVLLIASTCFTVSAEYVIVPYSEDLDIPEELVNRDGADGTLSFWELPLQLQLVSCFCFLSLSSFGVLKFLPFLLGKIRCNKGNKNRQKILSYVSDNPGCAEIDVLKDLGIKRGTFRYHFGKLELVNILVSVRHGRFVRYFRREYHRVNRISSLNLKSDTRKNVLETILEKPGMTGVELSSELGLDKSTIYWHLYRLKEDNKIYPEKHGRFKRYYPGGSFTAGQDNKVPASSK
ncbi:MAG: winged helix-turn-helix transcriptional regulator [Methanolobus sp.]|nr:winged helix-turn-helix transcriptional regulator [Methanolobus sp.]